MKLVFRLNISNIGEDLNKSVVTLEIALLFREVTYFLESVGDFSLIMYDMRVNDPGIVEEVMMMTILVGVGVSSANTYNAYSNRTSYFVTHSF